MDEISRRRLIMSTVGLAAGCGLGVVYETRRGPGPATRLRPPGAQTENDFLAACIRCGQCVEACPFETLRLADVTGGMSAGTPYLIPDEVPCYLCQEYDAPQCIDACPTDALMPLPDLLAVRMGTAFIDEERCWAYTGTICRACWHTCPWPDEAIRLNERLRPVVDSEVCVGCGLCEHACPTDPPSIVIEPPSVGAEREA